MKQRAPLLVFGQLPPTMGVAAETVQSTIALSKNFRVTIVVSDTAPTPSVFQASAEVEVIRMRDLRTSASSYKLHQRLYILDDSYLSLFALDLYEEAPGIVWAPSGKIPQLIHDHFASQSKWPQNYADWLAGQLGAEGEIIAHGFLHHRRLSAQLLEELPPLAEANIASTSTAAAIINPQDVYAPPTLTMYEPTEADASVQNCRNRLGLDDAAILVVATPSGAAQHATETLGKLKTNTTNNLHFVFTDQTEEDLSELAAAADIILVTAEAAACPPLVSAALSHAKAIITCSQPWAAALPTHCCINTAHSEALHQITAGLAALASDTALRNWYSENMRLFAKTRAVADGLKLITDRLQKKQQPLTLKSKETLKSKGAFKSTNGSDPNTPSLSTPDGHSLAPGAPRSVALIGAVPPRPLLQKLIPEIDWATSPRFATPELATILCRDTPLHAANKLALLGYESPLITNGNSKHKNVGQNWADVRQNLKATPEALSFGCSVDGAISADTVIPRQSETDYELSLIFRKSESPKVLSHFEESCGLFWHLDPVRHEINCLLVAGLTGEYEITLETNNFVLLVADAEQSAVLKANEPAILTSNNRGVLSFTLVALDNTSLTPQNHEILTKTLADCDLSLKWLNNG